MIDLELNGADWRTQTQGNELCLVPSVTAYLDKRAQLEEIVIQDAVSPSEKSRIKFLAILGIQAYDISQQKLFESP